MLLIAVGFFITVAVLLFLADCIGFILAGLSAWHDRKLPIRKDPDAP